MLHKYVLLDRLILNAYTKLKSSKVLVAVLVQKFLQKYLATYMVTNKN